MHVTAAEKHHACAFHDVFGHLTQIRYDFAMKRIALSLVILGWTAWFSGCTDQESNIITEIFLSTMSVSEAAPNGTVVATLSTDSQFVSGYLLPQDSSGGLGILDNQLIIEDSLLVDHETQPEINITLRAISTTGDFYEEPFVIEVLDEEEVTSSDDSGLGTLRQAIFNATSGDTIYLDESLSPITLSTGIITINKDLTIIGAAASQAILDGNDTQRIFEVINGNELTLDSMTLRNGRGGSGGCIQNISSTLNLRQVILDGCTAPGGNRGGGFQSSNTAETNVVDSVIQNCVAESGGGFSNENNSTMTMERSLVIDNQTTDGDGAGGLNTGATLSIANSTLTGNATSGTTQDGGSLANIGGGTINVLHATIIENSATGDGGGIYSDGALQIRNSIVATNTADQNSPDLSASDGTISLSTYNFVGDGAGSGLVNSNNGNLVGFSSNLLDPELEELMELDGITSGFVPAEGSPVLNQIPVEACVDFENVAVDQDQQQSSRPQQETCDIGSIEFTP